MKSRREAGQPSFLSGNAEARRVKLDSLLVMVGVGGTMLGSWEGVPDAYISLLCVNVCNNISFNTEVYCCESKIMLTKGRGGFDYKNTQYKHQSN